MLRLDSSPKMNTVDPSQLFVCDIENNFLSFFPFCPLAFLGKKKKIVKKKKQQLRFSSTEKGIS